MHIHIYKLVACVVQKIKHKWVRGLTANTSTIGYIFCIILISPSCALSLLITTWPLLLFSQFSHWRMSELGNTKLLFNTVMWSDHTMTCKNKLSHGNSTYPRLQYFNYEIESSKYQHFDSEVKINKEACSKIV